MGGPSLHSKYSHRVYQLFDTPGGASVPPASRGIDSLSRQPFMSKRRTTGTATGRPPQYLDDNGRQPAPPEGGWLTSSVDSQAGGELIQLLKSGLVEPDANPSTIWKNWPNLRSVNPAVYRNFVQNCKREAGVKPKTPPRRKQSAVSFNEVSRTRRLPDFRTTLNLSATTSKPTKSILKSPHKSKTPKSPTKSTIVKSPTKSTKSILKSPTKRSTATMPRSRYDLDDSDDSEDDSYGLLRGRDADGNGDVPLIASMKGLNQKDAPCVLPCRVVNKGESFMIIVHKLQNQSRGGIVMKRKKLDHKTIVITWNSPFGGPRQMGNMLTSGMEVFAGQEGTQSSRLTLSHNDATVVAFKNTARDIYGGSVEGDSTHSTGK